MTAVYIALGVFGFIALELLMVWIDMRPHKKYRVVQNALGKFDLQSWERLTPSWANIEDPSCDGERYGYVTIRTFDLLEEASSEYLNLMKLDQSNSAEERLMEMNRRALEREKELSKRIVKVCKI